MPELETVLTIKDKQGNLEAIVYCDMKKRSQIFHKVTECGAEEIKLLLEKIATQTTNTQ